MTYFSILLCRPAYGGKFCEGSSRSYKLCNTEDCPPNTTDYRAQQCAEFNSKQFRGWYYNWRPYTRVDGETTQHFLRQNIKMIIKETFWGRPLPVSHIMVVNCFLVFFSFLPDQDVCKLYCFAEGYDFFFALASKVKDGTLCSQDSSNVCIDGLCEVILQNVKQ